MKNRIITVFLTNPICDFYPHKMHSKHDSDIIQAETYKLLNKGATIQMILNLKKFNDFPLVLHYKLESIENALNLIAGCYFALVDLKDTYYSIPIHKDFQKYLKMY